MRVEAPRFDYSAMLGGMLVTDLGAGMLNGEVVKVGMSAIPPERAGMASGISGTIRFSGITVGFAVLGAILFARISSTVMTGLPNASASERIGLIRDIAAGNLSGGLSDAVPHAVLKTLAIHSFGDGYPINRTTRRSERAAVRAASIGPRFAPEPEDNAIAQDFRRFPGIYSY
jgi:hypothetical protein